MNIDDDILQDFLIEAGELFEQLGEQIVELEQQPQDSELLNAIFRAFHTIKGGAGFLKVAEMVEVCHRAEDVFNVLRQGDRIADATLIDVILQVIDVVGDMFEQLRAGEALTAAEPALLAQLETLVRGEDVNSPGTVGSRSGNDASDNAAADTAIPVEAATSMDEEFEAMLRATQAQANQPADNTRNPGAAGEPDTSKAASGTSAEDLITDDEFENLLDQLHGVGRHSGTVPAQVESDTQADNRVQDEEADKTATDRDDDIISDDEFEAVLDQMYGKNKGPGTRSGNDTKTDTLASAEPARADKPAAETAAGMATADAVSEETTDTASDKKPVTKRKTAAAPAESSVRVDTARLDDIMNLVGELVLVRNRLSMLKQITSEGRIIDAIANLELVTSDLQASVMKTRMQPIKKVFNRFPRGIRDLARQLNKDINLELVGEDTDLDKNLVEALADPLIHLVRNSVDHGIESPEERYKQGKPRQGTVTLCAAQEGDQILLTISDDGKGMDHEVLRKIAVDKELMTEEAVNRLSDTEVYNLIFAPGFSTKTEISDVSGRGVGMDVVKTRITELNGTLEIDSRKGHGTVITIRLPLTLAILPTLMVNLGDYQFALPLSNVVEAFNMEPDMINVVDGQEVMQVRNRPLPLYYLYQWLVQGRSFEGPKNTHKVIVVQMGSQQFCLVVDHLIGQEEVVIKPLGAMITDTPGFAGATITGDGSIALVLDMPGLINRYASGY